MNLRKHHWWWLGDGSVGLMLEPQGPMGSSLTSHIKKKKKKIKSRHGCRVLGWGGKDRRIPGSQGKGWGQSACEMQKLLCPCPSHLRSPRSHSWTRRHPLATPHLEVYLVSQQLDTKLLTASLVLVAISNAFASTGLRHLLPPRPRMQCALLGPGSGFGTSWQYWNDWVLKAHQPRLLLSPWIRPVESQQTKCTHP